MTDPYLPRILSARLLGRSFGAKLAFVILSLSVGLAFAANAFWLSILTSVAIYSLCAAGIGMLYRRLGQVSLVHVALMGCGGWIALRLDFAFDTPFTLNLIAGGLFASVVGAVLAYPALRMRGLYLALLTLMAAGGFSILITKIRFPNGADNLMGFDPRHIQEYMDRPLFAEDAQGYFLYCVAVALIGFVIMYAHEIYKPGRAWAIIRRSEAAAMAAGVNVTLYKIWGFALSGFLAGLAGVLLAGNLQLLNSESFPASESVLLFALTIVAGVWHWSGALVAAILYRLVPALLNDLGVSGDAALIIFGGALVHTIMIAPKGLVGLAANLGRRKKATSEGTSS